MEKPFFPIGGIFFTLTNFNKICPKETPTFVFLKSVLYNETRNFCLGKAEPTTNTKKSLFFGMSLNGTGGEHYPPRQKPSLHRSQDPNGSPYFGIVTIIEK